MKHKFLFKKMFRFVSGATMVLPKQPATVLVTSTPTAVLPKPSIIGTVPTVTTTTPNSRLTEDKINSALQKGNLSKITKPIASSF